MKAPLNRIGEVLYGDRWQSRFADDFEVSERTVHRWLAGQPLPSNVWHDIFMRLHITRDQVNFLIEQVKKEIDRGGSK